jgi:3',5'-cyclic AMP phosphodiesterase CpdA
MLPQTLAHLSDLHIGRGPAFDAAAEALCGALLAEGIDHVLVSGDVTNRGKHAELERFQTIFRPLLTHGRVLVVPGNHDRLGEDAGGALMVGPRVQTASRGGLYLVMVDSTGPHNRRLLDGHGVLHPSDLDDIDRALDAAPAGAMTVVMLHHHPLPLPEELVSERLSAWLRWPNAAELARGPELVERIRGRCDLVLHGHRHLPAEIPVPGAVGRPLTIYNAGSSTELRRFRVFGYRGRRLLSSPRWMGVGRVGRVGSRLVGAPIEV